MDRAENHVAHRMTKHKMKTWTHMNRKLGRGIRLFFSYGLDWLVSLIIIVSITFFLDKFQHFREFDLTDTTIQYPHIDKEIIPVTILAGIIGACYIIPVIGNLIFLRSWWDFHHSMLGLNVGFAIAGAITQAVRVAVGRPRPDFLARCIPAPGAVNAPGFGLANITVCTSTDAALIKDGMRSFFSGHASLTAAGLGFSSLYLAGKLHMFNGKGYVTKVWICLIPISGAVFVCITRTMDNYHHWQDVTIGALVGFVSAYFSYRQFYPPLSANNCHLPFAPRIPFEKGPQQVIDRSGRPQNVVFDDQAEGTPRFHPPIPPLDYRLSMEDIETATRYSQSVHGHKAYGEEYPLVPRQHPS